MGAFDFGSLGGAGGSPSPMMRDPWGMLTNVGMGMLANSQQSPGVALGKGWEQAQGQQLQNLQAGAFLDEQDRKHKQQAMQQEMINRITKGLDTAQQPIPQGAPQPPPPPMTAPDIGVGATLPSQGQPNPAGANAANTAAINNISGAQPLPQPQPGPQGGTMPGPPLPRPGGMQGGMQQGAAGDGSINIMGMQVAPQQVGAFKMWAAAGDYDKAFTALTAGDPNLTDVLKNYHAYVTQQVKSGKQPLDMLQYQQALRTQNNTTVNVGAGETALKKKFGEEMGTQLAATVDQGMKAGETKGMIQQYMEIQKASGNSGQFDALREKFGPWLKMIGVDVDVSKMGAAQAMDAITNKMAPALRVKGSGNTSDRDIMLFLNSLPQLQNAPGGNALIHATLDSVSEAQIKAGEIAAQIGDGSITLSEGMKQIRALDPFKGFKDKAKEYGVDMSGNMTGTAKPAPLSYDPKKGWSDKWTPKQQGGWLMPTPSMPYGTSTSGAARG